MNSCLFIMFNFKNFNYCLILFTYDLWWTITILYRMQTYVFINVPSVVMQELDPPPWLNRMRELGYPPGYLGKITILWSLIISSLRRYIVFFVLVIFWTIDNKPIKKIIILHKTTRLSCFFLSSSTFPFYGVPYDCLLFTHV
jgi:hypothetical protein